MKNESVKKSLEKSKNVPEEKRKMVKKKFCIKDQRVYNNCYELRARAINQTIKLQTHFLLKFRGNIKVFQTLIDFQNTFQDILE